MSRKDNREIAQGSLRYTVFRRRARNFDEFSSARKYTIATDLTYEEARRCCVRYNDTRTQKQIDNGTKYEFTAQ